jgi:hypothetical protein
MSPLSKDETGIGSSTGIALSCFHLQLQVPAFKSHMRDFFAALFATMA